MLLLQTRSDRLPELIHGPSEITHWGQCRHWGLGMINFRDFYLPLVPSVPGGFLKIAFTYPHFPSGRVHQSTNQLSLLFSPAPVSA
jgi:hypothetical protein